MDFLMTCFYRSNLSHAFHEHILYVFKKQLVTNKADQQVLADNKNAALN